MNGHSIDGLANSVLYAGAILYPYRSGEKTSIPRYQIGRIYPEIHHEQCEAKPCAMQTECLVEGPASARLEIIARFLQPMARDIGQLAAPLREMPAPNNPDFFHVVPELEVDGQLYASRLEAVERALEIPSLTLGELCAQARDIPFNFVATRSLEPIRDAGGHIAGVIVRGQEAIEGAVEIAAVPVGPELVRITVRLVNRSPMPREVLDDWDEIFLRTFASSHTLLHVRGGGFVSLIDPPALHARVAATCENLGAWPVLIGDEATQTRDTMLSSPVILSDYPKIESQTVDDLFEMDEVLPTPRHRFQNELAVVI